MTNEIHHPEAVASHRMRILFVHHAHDPGGAVRSLAMLVAGLDKQKLEPIVVIPDRPGSDAVRHLLEVAGAKVIAERHVRPFHGSTVVPCATLREKIYSLAGFPLLALLAAKLVRQIRPDIVHLNSTSVIAAAAGVRMSGMRTPVIAHVREPLLSSRWGRLLAALNRKFVDYFVSIDEAGLRSLEPPIVRGSVIFNFVDATRFRPDEARRAALRRAQGWNEDDIVFLSLARITPANGALELARFVHAHNDRLNARARFAIAGFEPEGGLYQQQVRDAIARSDRCDAIAFTHDAAGLIDAADVIVAPFTVPHSARSVFEGAAMGKPALVTRLSNLLELIREGETGFSYDMDCPQELIDAVNRLCDDGTRESLSDAAFRFGVEEFGAEANVARTVAVYHEMLAALSEGGAKIGVEGRQ